MDFRLPGHCAKLSAAGRQNSSYNDSYRQHIRIQDIQSRVPLVMIKDVLLGFFNVTVTGRSDSIDRNRAHRAALSKGRATAVVVLAVALLLVIRSSTSVAQSGGLVA